MRMLALLVSSLVLLAHDPPPGSAQRLSDRFNGGSNQVPQTFHVPGSQESTGTAEMALSGIGGGAIAAALSWALAIRALNWSLEGGVSAASVAESLALPAAVNLANQGRGSYAQGAITSLAIGSLGLLYFLSERSDLSLAIAGVAVPLAQLPIVIAIERHTSPPSTPPEGGRQDY